MKKQLNTSSILNELEEGSAFFRRGDSASAPSEPKHPAPVSQKAVAPEVESETSTKVTQNRTGERFNRTEPPIGLSTSAAPASAVLTSIDDPHDEGKRLTERYSFEIYTDQKETINDVKYLYYKKTGRKVSSSELVRDALDLFLARVLEKLEG
ncbi:hypothetical protein [Aggregatilinea lenta]|uniref:hypothetical protein n=1 Tax=Aggregatilinea lenta TaxID=913108 RepID=UPI000E5C51F1|nr:hypothetical protein [Aggregatilinea lenta]